MCSIEIQGFWVNTNNFSLAVIMFILLPWMKMFNSFKCVDICAMYAKREAVIEWVGAMGRRASGA